MKTKSLLVVGSLLSLSIISAVSCSKEPDSSNVNSVTLDVSQSYDYRMVSSEMGQLGRVLFYDKSLSLNNSVSCGSCHIQAFAFSDNKQFSEGFESVTTSRNTPPIQNLSEFDQALFWDGRERLLQNMVMKPIFNHVEMGMRNTAEVTRKVEERGYYKELFVKAFGNEEITFEKISKALGGFTSSIQTHDSRFERSMMFTFIPFENLPTGTFTPVERKGFDLFFGKYNCGSCHNVFSSKGYDIIPDGNGEPTQELVNIGLDFNYADNGKGDLTGTNEDKGRFKIPNLRNSTLTAPYMHDGRFNTLEEVIDHYSTGIETHPNLDDRLKDDNGTALVMNISSDEKQSLISFLGTLTDNTFITDPKFSDPFKKN